MIMDFVKKVPAGMMVVPLCIGCLLNTFFPQALEIGGLTTALFSNAGSATSVGILLFCMGTTLRIQDMGTVVKRGGLLLISKFLIGAVIGIAVGKIFGMTGVLGISSVAIISAMTNSNGSVYFSLMTEFGDKEDCACMPILAINDGPFLTLIALGASGIADIPLMSLVAALIPIIVGMILGNLDKKVGDFFGPVGPVIIPFTAVSLGAGINLADVVRGGASGILLSILTIFVGGAFIAFCDHVILKRSGYAGWAVATTAGNAVAVPAAVALADPKLEPVVATATVQVAASVVMSALLVPLIVSWWSKKFGCPKYPKSAETKAAEA